MTNTQGETAGYTMTVRRDAVIADAHAISCLWRGLCRIADDTNVGSVTLDDATDALQHVMDQYPSAVSGLGLPQVMGGGQVE
jgi:hypothetical protein